MASTSQGSHSFRQELVNAAQWPNKRKRKETEPEKGEIDKFVPAPDIEALTTQSRIKQVLEILARGNLLARIHEADPPVKKIFLILAQAKLLDVTEKFISEKSVSGDLSDQHLPITLSERGDSCVVKPARDSSSAQDSSSAEDSSSTQDSCSSDYLLEDRNITDAQLGWFQVQQWQFLSPVFKNQFKFHLQPLIPLPLIEKDRKGPESGFGVVYKVKVHPGHISEGSTGDLAMKELNLEDKNNARCLRREMKNLESLCGLDHRHLIRPIVVCTRGKRAFFFFPWADKGDLYSFWKDPTVRKDMVVPWMLGQMVGLSNALELLAEKNCRHSDLKPQNILVFPSGNSMGTLKITDVGISKFHILATTRRLDPTSAKTVTIRYGPPEFDELKPNIAQGYLEGSHDQKLSRRFDIWSLGCVFFEFLIWAKLGLKEYLGFDKVMGGSQRFWDRPEEGSDSESSDTSACHYVLHRSVQRRLTKLKGRLGHTPEDIAIHDVLTLVEENMLVFDCTGRYTASEVHNCLKEIQDRSKFGSLLNGSTMPLGLTGEPFLDVPLREQQQRSIAGSTATLGVDLDVAKPFSSSEGLTTTAIPQDNAAAQRDSTSVKTMDSWIGKDNANKYVGSRNIEYSQLYHRSNLLFTSSILTASIQRQIAKLRDQWTVTTDNNFARVFFSRATSPFPRGSRKLCDMCARLHIWKPEFTLSRNVGGFKSRSLTCDLCKLLYSVSKKLGLGRKEKLRLTRNGTVMNTTGHESTPILSLFADPGSNTPDLEFAQVGYPTSFPAESPQQFQLLRQWLHVCDTEHGHRSEVYRDSLQMPTRLIHIGDSKEHLEVIQESSFLCYAALSHCWGNSPKLCTLTSNLEAFRKEIPHNLLPLNFQEAIRVARALGIPYLWIDSLCIVQDDLADWEREAGRMGQVFSNAYCTIAATSAAASDEGFLARQTGPPLSAAIGTPDGGIIHISEFMEDYHQDLELAPLNTRGWVLQERALSRRTLHFTKTQVYWECGAGVHCERLFKLSNPQATLFADSDFPNAILKHFKGGRITLFQHLYQTYSRLSFSHISDRSVAILGLEKRLLDAFQTRGGFGIFEVYLARSLLWSRQEDVFLNLIPCKKRRPPPSWSWMAYQGPITYMEIPFDQVDWTTDCVFPSDSEIATNTRGPALKAMARDLTLSRLDVIHRVKLDQQAEIRVSDLRGVVLGKDKRRESREPMHYVLLITLSRDQLEGKEVYVRVGVAWLLEHNIAPGSEEVEVY